MKPNRLLSALFILWIFFVLASFYAVQKPFDAATAQAVGGAALDLLTAAWLGLVGLGLGYALLRRLALPQTALAEELILGTGLGLGLLGLLGLALGLLGLFQPWIAYLVLLGLTLPAVPALWTLLGRSRRRSFSWPHPLAALYLGLISLMALLLALLPPSDWDGLFYHLTAPKLYLQAGGIVTNIDVPHFNFPFLMEMLFAWAMLLRGDVAAVLLHTLFGLLLAGLVYQTARRWLAERAAWPAVLLLASMPMLGTLAAWAYNDLALAFYQLAALYAFARYALDPKVSSVSSLQRRKKSSLSPRERAGVRAAKPTPPQSEAPQRDQSTLEAASQSQPASPPLTPHSSLFTLHSPWLLLSGLLAGLAMGLKYTSFITPLFLGLILLFSLLTRSSLFVTRRFSRPSILTDLILFSLAAALVAAPWYLKNWLFTGNPVYPFLYDVFGGQFWDAFRAEWYAAAGTGVGWALSTLLSLPWLLTLGVRDANFWDGRTGPLLLLFLPLLLWAGLSRRWAGREVPPAVRLLLLYLLAHFGVWSLGVIWSRSLWQSRLLLPGLAALAPLVGWVWISLPAFDAPRFSLSRFVNVTVGLVLALTVIDVGLLTLKIDPLPALVGLESREEYLTRRLGAHYAAMQQLNAETSPQAKIVFLWEPRSYYCRRDCRPDSILDEFPHLVYQYGSAAAIAQQWRQAGVTHVLLHRSGLEFVLNDAPETVDLDILTRLEDQHWQELFDVAGAYQLYALDGE